MKNRRLALLLGLLLAVTGLWLQRSLNNHPDPDRSLSMRQESDAFFRVRLHPPGDSTEQRDKLVPEGPPPLARLFENAYTLSNDRMQPEYDEKIGPSSAQIELVWVPAGMFVMGSPAEEVGREALEGPETEVTLSQGFWLSKYEITVGQYWTVLKQTAVDAPGQRRRVNRKPIVNISWEEAMSFCTKLNTLESSRLPDGYLYRLPTEAEWEYGSRAGTSGPFGIAGVIDETSSASTLWCVTTSGGTVHDVGSHSPNSWGLHDMHGNAAEWVLDELGPYPGITVTNPIGSIESVVKVRRGGSWRAPLTMCRSASRLRCGSGGDAESGFRIALAPALLQKEQAAEQSSGSSELSNARP